MPGEFENRIALVTGASRGIGKSTALKLAAGGADVAVGYASRSEAAEEVVKEIEAMGRRAIACRCDVASGEDIQTTVEKTREALGPIGLLAHCGAIADVATHDEIDFERWERMINVDLHGTFRIVHAVKDEMIERQFGRMVLLSSCAALAPRPNMMHYSAAKAGVIALGRSLAAALARDNIRVNCIAPGLINTEMVYTIPQERIQELMEATPMPRMGTPEEIAELAAFLLSERSSFTTGQTIIASGGRLTLP